MTKIWYPHFPSWEGSLLWMDVHLFSLSLLSDTGCASQSYQCQTAPVIIIS